MKPVARDHSKHAPRPAGSRLVRRVIVAALVLTLDASAQEMTVDEAQLEQLENLFVLVWYFTLFCAFAAGVRTGLVR